MLRTALSRRFLGLLALALVLAAVFVQLGRWQLGVAQDNGRREAIEKAATAAPVPLSTVLAPHSAFPNALSARPVSVTGRYTEGQLLVPDRRLDGVTGSWVITPFRVDGTDATLPVLRGFVPGDEKAGAAPTGPLTLTGGIAPGESPSTAAVGPGEIGSVDTSVLVNTWPGDLYNAFLFLSAEQPSTGPQLTKVPTPLGPTGVTWRNAAYAVQWWVFAVFALWMWWRMVREEHRGMQEVDDLPPPGDDLPPPDDGPATVPDPAPEPATVPARIAGDDGRREHL